MNCGEDELRISLLLVRRRTNFDAAEAHLQYSCGGLAALVAHLDRMKATNLSSIHLGSDHGIAISIQPVYAGAHKEMRSQSSGKAKQFVDIALSISDMTQRPASPSSSPSTVVTGLECFGMPQLV
jgi:hypothetical protein